LIRAGAEEATRRAAEARPWTLPAGSRVEVEFDHQARADQAAAVPTVERAGERTVTWMAQDGLDFHRTWRAVTRAASIKLSP